VLLDVAIGIGGPLAGASARGSLCGAERWEYGGHPPIGVYDDPKLTESRSDRMLGLVDFTLLPHLDADYLPDNSMADAEKWAAGIPVPAYAIDDQTAITVIDGEVSVVSEGHWKRFTP
jgi:dipeptidase E